MQVPFTKSCWDRVIESQEHSLVAMTTLLMVVGGEKDILLPRLIGNPSRSSYSEWKEKGKAMDKFENIFILPNSTLML